MLAMLVRPANPPAQLNNPGVSQPTGPNAQTLPARILAALPQTQCTRCGYPDCAAYASAIALDGAPINQCPPGGQQGIERLAAITAQPALAQLPLNPQNGLDAPRAVAVIDENWCIGCTLCIDACPTDAILGSNKRMHTVIEPYCTGCELCLPVCPVDCIAMENVSGNATGWAAWSQVQADQARSRYELRTTRLALQKTEHSDRHEVALQAALDDLPANSRIQDPEQLAKKRAVVEAALARARARKPG
jgi:Na+-translocating ferredoxin:NAD+ oxidoreductase subunit B